MEVLSVLFFQEQGGPVGWRTNRSKSWLPGLTLSDSRTPLASNASHATDSCQPTLCVPLLVFYLLSALSPLLLGQLLLNFKEVDHCLLWEADSPPVCIKGLSCVSVYLALSNSNGQVILSNPPGESDGNLGNNNGKGLRRRTRICHCCSVIDFKLQISLSVST